jgi:hypothetical protein
MNIERLVKFTAVTVGLLCFVGVARGQTAPPWNENRVSWGAPTACQSGLPITSCPISGYILERGSSVNGTFTLLATTAANVTNYTHFISVAGVNCYRAIATALPPLVNSPPSPVACRTNTPPDGPSSPTGLSVTTITITVTTAP